MFCDRMDNKKTGKVLLFGLFRIVRFVYKSLNHFKGPLSFSTTFAPTRGSRRPTSFKLLGFSGIVKKILDTVESYFYF